jgi:hypothetical protein
MTTRHYITILFSVFIFSMNSHAQDLLGLDPNSLKTEQDYKNAEERVLSCADYLLTNPIDEEELIRTATFSYLFRWIEGTPEHSFSLDADVVQLTNNNKDFLTIYFAGLAKSVLENSTEPYTEEETQDRAIQYLIDYCSNPDHHLKPTKRMNKMSKKNKT